MQSDLSSDPRVILLRQSIIETYVRRSPARFTIYRLLNRMVFAFDQPLVFVLLRRTKRHFDVKVLTPRDPITVDDFEATLRKLGVKNKSLPKTSPAQTSFIQVCGTDYFILALRVQNAASATEQTSRPFQEWPIKFEPLRPSDTAFLVLKEVFATFDQDLKRLSRNIDFSEHMRDLFESSDLIKATFDDPDDYPASPYPPKGLVVSEVVLSSSGAPSSRNTSVLDRFDRVLEQEINNLGASPLLTRDTEDVPNVLIYRKFFSRQEKRIGHYFFDSMPFFPESLLRRMASSYRRRQVGQALVDRIPFPHPATEKWIRDALQRTDIPALSAPATTPLSSHLRQFVDYVLFTGTALLYRDPFSTGYLGWIEDGEECPSAERELELRRLALIHYFLLLGAPKHLVESKNEVKPYVLLLPIRVSGAVFMVSASVVDGSRIDDPLAEDETVSDEEQVLLVSRDEFQYRTCLYHDLIKDFESRVRRKFKDAYLAAVGDLFSDTVQQAVEQSRLRSKHGDMPFSNVAAERVNGRIVELTRYCPYEPVVFIPGRLPGQLAGEPKQNRANRVRVLGFAQGIDIARTERNPFFDRARLEPFLNAADVQDRLQDVINARLGAWRAYHDLKRN